MDVDRPTKVIADEVLVLDSSTFIKEVGLTKEGASALKHYLFHRGTQLVVVLSRCHLQRLPRFIHSGWPSGHGKLIRNSGCSVWGQ